jgi:hypothetical protein
MSIESNNRLPSTVRHHQSLLSVMSEFVNVEYLTDVTLKSAEGTELNAHRKILAQVSPIIRKFAATMPHDQRINISLPVRLLFKLFERLTLCNLGITKPFSTLSLLLFNLIRKFLATMPHDQRENQHQPYSQIYQAVSLNRSQY